MVFFPPCFLPSSSAMHFYYFFLLLLVVLSAYSETPHYAKPPDFLDPIRDTVCPNSSSAQLGIFTPVLPQNEMFGFVHAQILLENHKCETCSELLAVFKPYRVTSNTEHQKTWYQKNTEKCTSYEKHHYPTSEYQESQKKSSQKYYWFKKDVKFPPVPPSSELCQKIISEFCADTFPDVFEEAGCAVCGKLTPICEMEELSEVEN